jgi:hypothetical protein
MVRFLRNIITLQGGRKLIPLRPVQPFQDQPRHSYNRNEGKDEGTEARQKAFIVRTQITPELPLLL